MKDESPAYPAPAYSQNQATGESVFHYGSEGMQLRDFFAAHALAIAVRSFESPQPMAKLAYAIADEMMLARKT